MRRINSNKRKRVRQIIAVRPQMGRFFSNMLFDWWYFYVSPGYSKVRKIIRIFLGAGICMGSLAAVVFLFFGTEAGYLEAKYDLWRQHYEIRTYTSDRAHVVAYRELLKTYGIAYRRVTLSAFNPFTTNHFEAYNRTMKKGIRTNLELDVEALFRLFTVLEMMDDDVAQSQPQPSQITFYEQIVPLDSENTGNNADETHILMQTRKPATGSSDHFRISKCHIQLEADLDGDSGSEKICLRELKFKGWERRFLKRSVVVDVYKNSEQILRQEFGRGAYGQEKYLKMINVDADGRKGLVTAVKFGPQCAGCLAHRIYVFEQDRFVPVLHLFGVDPENAFVQTTLLQLSDLEDRISGIHRNKTGIDHPCGLRQNCINSPLWLVDINADQRPEGVFLAQPPYGENFEEIRVINIVIARLAPGGKITNFEFHPTDIACCEGFVDLLGLIKTRDNRIHLLVNFACAGTSISYPVLHIFELSTAEVKPIGEFAGFYEQVICERLLDLDKDGNNEIIFLEDSYWPPGASHSEMVPIYGIAKYTNGGYQQANLDFTRAYRRLNRHFSVADGQ